MKIKKKRTVDKKNVKITADLHAKVHAYTEKEGMNIEGFVNRAVELRLASLAVTAGTRSGVA